MKEEAYKLISAKDTEDGESWSNDSDEIAEMMASFAKAQLEQLLSDLDSLDSLGVSWDRRHLEIYEHYHSSDYIKVGDLKTLIGSWRAKL